MTMIGQTQRNVSAHVLVVVWVGYDAGVEGIRSAFGPVREVLEGVFGD